MEHRGQSEHTQSIHADRIPDGQEIKISHGSEGSFRGQYFLPGELGLVNTAERVGHGLDIVDDGLVGIREYAGEAPGAHRVDAVAR